jgi:hypothetical protein
MFVGIAALIVTANWGRVRTDGAGWRLVLAVEQGLVELGDEGCFAVVSLPQVGDLGGETRLVAGAVVGVP